MKSGVWNEKIEDSFNQLFSEILLAQSESMGVRGPTEQKRDEQEKILATYASEKGRGFFYSYLSSGKGHGPFTELSDGSIKYDLIGAIGVNLLGHSHPVVIKAHLEAALQDVVMCGNLLTHPEAAALTHKLVESVKGSKLKHFWFAGSGSFANDNALKMIWQKAAPKTKVLALNKAFAGRSIATQEITYNPEYRQGMPKLLDVIHIENYNQRNPTGSWDATLKSLEAAYKEHGNELSCITFEIVQGEGGFIYGERDYYVKLCEWAKSKGLYIWIDEVQSFARTTELFAFQAFQLDEYVDIVTVGKALQACGTFFSEELNPKPGLISGTFNGSIAGLKAGLASIRLLTEGPFYGPTGRMKELETTFLSKFNDLMNGSCKGKLTFATGIGTMIAFEVAEGDGDKTKQVVKELFEAGIVCFTAGHHPTRIRFLLPITLTSEHIEELFSIVEKTICESTCLS